MLIYVILLSSDCFKVQGHLVPRLYTLKDLFQIILVECNYRYMTPCTIQKSGKLRIFTFFGVNTKYISSSAVKNQYIFSPHEMKYIWYLPEKVNFLFLFISSSTKNTESTTKLFPGVAGLIPGFSSLWPRLNMTLA